MSLYLQLPSGKKLPCSLSSVSFGQAAFVSLTGQTNDTPPQPVQLFLRGSTRELSAELYRLWDGLHGKTVAQVLDLTPEQVVMYFECSPVLREMAADVRAALLGGKGAASTGSTGATGSAGVEQDLARIRHLVSPSKADIAEVLTGQRTYGGAAYERVNRVYQALAGSETTTTTVETVETADLVA